MDRTRNLIDTLKAASPMVGFTVGQIVGSGVIGTTRGAAIFGLLFMFAMSPFLLQVTLVRPLFAKLVFVATPFVFIPIVALVYYLLGY
jgi:hypothetical protein